MATDFDARARAVPMDGYGSASLLLCWTWPSAKPQSERAPELAFARLELLPDEIPAPTTALLHESRHCTRPAWVALIQLPIDDAMDWYEKARAGGWTIPPVVEPLLKRGPVPATRQLSGVSEEPAWPSMNLLASRPAVFPFLWADMGMPRAHHVFSDAVTGDGWTEAEITDLGTALEPYLQFSLAAHRLLIGSAHLVLRDPILREAGLRLVPDPTTGDENIAVTLIPRRGKTLSDLTVTVWERRDTAVQRLATFSPDEPIVTVRLTGKRSEVGLVIDHPLHGRLHDSTPAPFISSIHLDVGLMEGNQRVRIDRGPRGTYEYATSLSQSATKSVLGSPAAESALQRIRMARTLAESERRVAALDEVFFHGEWERAHDELRRLVGGGQSRILIVDYFFSAGDVALVVPAVRWRDARVELLTSKEGLQKIAGKGRSAADAAKALVDQLETVSQSRRMQPVDARYMPGDLAEIHDRFLLIESQLFLLGSSLNEYGSRGTMLVRLRYPDRVRDRIDAAMANAKPLSDLAAGAKT